MIKSHDIEQHNHYSTNVLFHKGFLGKREYFKIWGGKKRQQSRLQSPPPASPTMGNHMAGEERSDPRKAEHMMGEKNRAWLDGGGE
jgi:hypothetical protein